MSVQTAIESQWVTINEASWELRVSHWAIQYRIRTGELETRWDQRHLMVDLEEVRKVMALYKRVPLNQTNSF